MELPVEHGLLLDNLLDLAHAPFTHTSTFAKGWTVPRFVSAIRPAIVFYCFCILVLKQNSFCVNILQLAVFSKTDKQMKVWTSRHLMVGKVRIMYKA